MNPEQLGKIVRYFRKQGRLSQVQLANYAGVGKTAVFDIEKGKPSVQLDTIIKVLAVLNIQMTLQTPFPYPKEFEE